MDVLENFKAIEVESPVDKIIKQIRNSIVSGQMKPGDKLPSERKLSESFGIGRTYVRDAIKKLEFYGILKTLPQSGTIVSGADISAMEGLISNVIKLNENDFFHLVETRVVMETYACGQAAIRRSNRDIADLEEKLDEYKQRVDANLPGIKEDFNFHIQITEASQNMVIKSLMLILIPDILEIYRKLNVCGEGRFYKSFDEHKVILDCIIKQDSKAAEEAMRVHLKDVVNFSLSYKGNE
ncbi:FadR/GntR family transcriptional regulator [Draconibacterium sp.]|uniref:FadR/GntR family transcriptional regulator n=1 Tax=Draconibacterium sp. TaxID=1965318 RepID=UPI0029C8D894|nr:FadR/GntR family transcriptional regulator [uncultured Draconibacterium sp.]